jgi:soluble lytic murein transglycosylase-like protein
MKAELIIGLFIVAVIALVAALGCYDMARLAPKPARARLVRWTVLACAVAGAALFAAGIGRASEIPRAAQQYHRPLVANARAVWGLNAPVATFAGQIHQESGWRPDARSPYAGGLAQFTPSTAEWIGGVFPDLAERQPFNPGWALRALVRYDRYLWERNPASSACDRMAFALAAYNGGEGWLRREQRIAQAAGAAPDRWFGAVALRCARAEWACAENRAYPAVILMRHQRLYAAWGPMTACPA